MARSAFQATTRSRAVTISIGLTEGHAGATESKLLRLADTALYRAKAQGRDRVVRYSAAAERPAPAPRGAGHRLQCGGVHIGVRAQYL